MPKSVMISEARHSLFDLFDNVVRAAGRKVVISRRNRDERAVLVSERYLTAIEEQVASLKAAITRLRGSDAPASFTLIGSATLHVPADDVLHASRAKQRELAAAKLHARYPVPQLAVTDSHALIWAATGQLKRLGVRARKLYERANAGHAALYVPTIVLVELSEAVRAGAVSLNLPFPDWVLGLAGTGHFHIVELTAEIVVRSHDLYDIPERGDRLIAATALILDVPLITRDAEIVRVAGVDQIW